MMPLKNKLVLIFSITILLFSFSSGCILEDLFGITNFTLKSWYVCDDEGFPSISMNFTFTNKIKLRMYNPDSELTDNNFFYETKEDNNLNCTLNIATYKENAEPGVYILKVYDKDNNQISKKTFNFDCSDVTILDCEQRWWQKGDSRILAGLELRVKNNGDLPVYITNYTLISGSMYDSGYVLPNTILPNSDDTIDCFLFLDNIQESDNFNLSLLDVNNQMVSSEHFKFQIDNLIQSKTFSDGLDEAISIPYPGFLYDYYNQTERIYADDFSLYVYNPYDEKYLNVLLDFITSSMEPGHSNFYDQSDVNKIDYINSFVQHLEFKDDSPINKSYEYPRYPVETLFNPDNGGGDCEDKAILSSNLLKILGYNVSLIRLSNHMAVGVNLSADATHYDYYSGGYYFLETTTPGKSVGFIPSEYKSPDELFVYPLTIRPFLTHKWKNDIITIYHNTEKGDYVKAIIYIENLGEKTARNITVEGVFEDITGNDMESTSKLISNLGAGMKEKILLSISIPNVMSSFKTRIYLNGNIVDEEVSKSYFPK